MHPVPYYSFIIAHLEHFVKGFFEIFLIFLPLCAVGFSPLVPLSPWYILSIPHPREKVNSYLVKSCTNYGIFCGRNLCKLPIDKIAEVWYNGKFGSLQPTASRPNLSIGKMHKKLIPFLCILTKRKRADFSAHLFNYVIQSSPSSNRPITYQVRQVRFQPFSTRL